MAWVAPVVAIAGSLLSAKGQQDAGAASQQSAEFTALQEDQAASNARASAQRSAEEQRRQGLLAQSRATALAAASGGGANDVTVSNIKGAIAGEAEYRALNALYKGEDTARTYANDAALRRAGGSEAVKAGNMAATGTLIQGGSSLLSRYGGNTPISGTTANSPSGVPYRETGYSGRAVG